MKDLFERLLNLLPSQFVLAVVLTGCVFLGFHYYQSNSSYSDNLRDRYFQTLAVVIFAIATLCWIHRDDVVTTVPGESSPLVIITSLSRDSDDQYRSMLVHEVADQLRRAVGMHVDVRRVNAHVGEDDSAHKTLRDYRAVAILYSGCVNDADDGKLLCLKVQTSEGRESLYLPPFKWSARESSISRIVNAVYERISASSPERANPLMTRIKSIEDRLSELLRTTATPSESTPKGGAYPKYSNNYAVVIGVDEVANLDYKLRESKSDAREFGNLLSRDYGFQVTLLLDIEATTDKISKAIDTVASNAKPDDMFVFYFVGFGSETIDLAPGGAKSATLFSYDSAKSYGVKTSEFVAQIRKVQCKHKVAIVDTCHSTSGLRGLLTSAPIPNADDEVFYFLGACGPDQLSREGKDGFTQTMIRTISARNSAGSTPIWIRDLVRLAQESMKDIRQTPELLRLEGTGDAAFTKPTRT